MSCRKLKKAGSNAAGVNDSYMLIDSAVATPAKAGGAKRGRKSKGGNLLEDTMDALKNVQDVVGKMNTASASPATGGCASANCRRTKKQGGNAVDLAPFAVALSLIGVRMLKDKQFMNKVDSVINSPSARSTSSRSRRST
jgi:hypothetical protein